MEAFIKEYKEQCKKLKGEEHEMFLRYLSKAKEPIGHFRMSGKQAHFFNSRFSSRDVAIVLSTINQVKLEVQSLDLSYNLLDDSCISFLEMFLKQNTSVRHLDLSSSGITTEGFVTFFKSNFQTSNFFLESLILDDNMIGDQGGIVLSEFLKKNKTLRVLSVNNISIKIHSFIAMVIELTRSPTIQVFRCSGVLLNQMFGTEHMEHLRGMFKNNYSLKYVDLTGMKIGDEGIRLICQGIKSNKGSKIERLILRGNSIGIDGSKYLSKFLMEEGTTIKYLDISYNKIKNEGGVEISGMLKKNTTLEVIKINDNRIGDVALSMIGDNLRMFNMSIKLLFIKNNYFEQRSMGVFEKLINGKKKDGEEFLCDVLPYKVDDNDGNTMFHLAIENIKEKDFFEVEDLLKTLDEYKRVEYEKLLNEKSPIYGMEEKNEENEEIEENE